MIRPSEKVARTAAWIDAAIQSGQEVTPLQLRTWQLMLAGSATALDAVERHMDAQVVNRVRTIGSDKLTAEEAEVLVTAIGKALQTLALAAAHVLPPDHVDQMAVAICDSVDYLTLGVIRPVQLPNPPKNQTPDVGA